MCRRACIPLVSLVFVACSCCLAVSQPAFAAPGEGNGKRAERRQRALQKFDTNGNGQLDPDEKQAANAAMQNRRDQGQGQGPGGQGARDPERRRKLLEKFDSDGDGKLSETERAAAKEARAKRGK